MKILLVCNNSNDVFISAMTKWLKREIPDIIIDIFEFDPEPNKENNPYVNTVCSYDKTKGPFRKGMFRPLGVSLQLKSFLKGKQYDIIQCHWIVRPVVLTRCLRKHCKKLIANFWGGELTHLKLFHSYKCYKYFLGKFIDDVDYVMTMDAFAKSIIAEFPQAEKKYAYGNLGAVALDHLYELKKTESKDESKNKLSLPTDKISVVIGYSGKTLHQHIPIIRELSTRKEIKERIHLFAPMTRGGAKAYITEVEKALSESGYTYTILHGKYLTDQEIARVRNATDITLQLSEFDAFSRSIVEFLCAESVLIYGDWLDYTEYLESDKLIAYSASDIKEAIDILENISANISAYSEECAQNSINAKKRNLWSECIKDWINVYNK